MDYIEKLTGLRQDRDINQAQIAKILGTHQATISKYELRQRKYQIEDIIKLCLFYNVSADWLLGLPDNLPYPKRK